MNKILLYSAVIFLFASCNRPKKSKTDEVNLQWQFKETVVLQKEVRPLSIAFNGDEIWLSEPAQNRLLKINRKGDVLDSITGLERPMNITSFDGKLYVPEYLSDKILIISSNKKDSLQLENQLDAPASIAISSSQIAIADFYNHRIILKSKEQEVFFGSEGSGQSQFHYPTDVKFYKDEIYVADAYNNQIQVFDTTGNFKKIIGVNAAINVASAIDVSENTIAVTDQENNRVLLFDLEGNLIQTLTTKINYPTDVLFVGNELWITNFKTNQLTIFKK